MGWKLILSSWREELFVSASPGTLVIFPQGLSLESTQAGLRTSVLGCSLPRAVCVAGEQLHSHQSTVRSTLP